MLQTSAADILILSACVIIHLVYRFHRRTVLPFPPGPVRWPVIGNTLAIPFTNAHVFYKKLGKNLGSKIVYLEALGQSIIVINDIAIAQDLLEKRSALYSNRPSVPMLNDVIGLNTYFSIMPYGEGWRVRRRMFQQYFSTKNLPCIQKQGIESLRKGLLPNLITSPEDFIDHIRNYLGGFSISITYGLPVKQQYDPFLRFAEETLNAANAAGAPGTFWVNIIPWLKYVPEWMPGAGFKQVGKKLRLALFKLEEEPYEATMSMMKDGAAPVSFISETMNRYRESPDFALRSCLAKQNAAQVFAAASATTVAALTSLILGLVIRPDVQSRAQQEVDSVVGPDRLPECTDISHLPFLSAVIKEVLRWNPIAPMGVPHTTSTDDVYMGYYIPKNCVIFPNAYAMLHDEETFPDPENFMPERFIKDGVIRTDLPDPEFVATFGFGRRICPGSHIARSILYITAASLLHLFDFSPEIDADGLPIAVQPHFASGSLVSEPLPFPCKITPRSGRNPNILLREYLENNFT